MWVIEAYFVWEAVSEALFWVSVGNFGWVGVDGPLFWVGGVGGGMWSIILGGCGWVMVGGKIFWVGGVESGWVQCLISLDGNSSMVSETWPIRHNKVSSLKQLQQVINVSKISETQKEKIILKTQTEDFPNEIRHLKLEKMTLPANSMISQLD